MMDRQTDARLLHICYQQDAASGNKGTGYYQELTVNTAKQIEHTGHSISAKLKVLSKKNHLLISTYLQETRLETNKFAEL